MQELLKNAWQGWLSYTDKGKYAALLLLVLLFFWFRREECKEKLLLVYTTIVVVCCIFPVTAVLLMKYQTRFFDYEWIWSYVPVTLMIAYGTVIFLYTQWEHYKKEEKSQSKWSRFFPLGLTIMTISVIVLCGGLGRSMADNVYDNVQRQNAKEILGALEETAEGQRICLWAPEEIMAAARGQRADIRLVYGRNMWEAALGAYSYETYGKTEEALYLWMRNAEETGSVTYATEDGRLIEGAWCIEAAKAAGVNTILLPGTIQNEELQLLLNQTGHALQQLEEYYLLIL